MNNLPVDVSSERSRVRAALVNSGAYSLFEADKKLSESSLSITLSDEAAATITGQAALLTAVVTAVRCFGEVTVNGNLNQAVILPLPLQAGTLLEAVTELGGHCKEGRPAARHILIGPILDALGAWSVQAFWDRWIAGVAAAGEKVPLGDSSCPLAGIAAGAAAVGQAFLAEQGDLRAGRSTQRLSLWSPESGETGIYDRGPEQYYLPLKLWLIGLGNLGQAYLWSLSTLPYPQPDQVLLFLQDDDEIDKGNWGTSVLVEKGRYEVLKTYIAEEWALRRKFKARRIDRRLDKHQRKTDLEPSIALAGLDRIAARRLLGYPGFDYVIDTGLGATAEDYQNIRMNVFNADYKPDVHFSGVEDKTEQTVKKLMELEAYKELARAQGDGGCGAAMLAEKSVAVPFVSAVVGALAIAQAIRIASGELPHLCLAGSLGDLSSIRATTGPSSKRAAVQSVLAQIWP